MSPARLTRLAGVATSLTLLVGGLSLAPTQAAERLADTPAASSTEERARAKPLKIKSPGVWCECGGAGYLWGWGVVGMRFTGARKGHTYRAFIKGGGEATNTQPYGYAMFSRADHDLEHGETYKFLVKEYKRKKLVRTSKATKYTIPTPVAHPELARLETIDADGEDYLVAGRTYSVAYDGEWQQGIQFAKGVDRYFTADGGFGWYQEDGYPLPWVEHAPDAALTLTPTDEHLGQQWNIYVVGSVPAPKDVPREGIEAGDPVRGSEWGHRWYVSIISEEEAARLQQ